MVEYALLLAGSSLGTFATAVSTLAGTASVYLSRVDWSVVSYLVLALLALRIAFWAFRSPS